MGFLKALRKRKAKKVAKGKAKLDEEAIPAVSPVSPMSPVPPSIIADEHPADDVNKPCDSVSNSIQSSASTTVATETASTEDVIDVENIETALTEADAESGHLLKLISSDGDSDDASLSINDLATMGSLNSASSMQYLWRYITCNLSPQSTFDILHGGDDDSTILTYESDSRSLATVATAPNYSSGRKDATMSSIPEVKGDATPKKKNLAATVRDDENEENSPVKELVDSVPPKTLFN